MNLCTRKTLVVILSTIGEKDSLTSVSEYHSVADRRLTRLTAI